MIHPDTKQSNRARAAGDRLAVPRWSLWIVAVICFGPLVFIWLFGVLALPLWVQMIGYRLADPESFSGPLSGSGWEPVWPILLVVGGFVGLVGLVRVLCLPQERPESVRFITIAMVAIGLLSLLVFDLPFFATIIAFDFTEGFPVTGFAVYLLLPITGAAWLLSRTWKFLIAPASQSSETSKPT